MRYFTGDESGLIKCVVFPPPPVEEKTRKRGRRGGGEDDNEDKKKKKQDDEPLHQVSVFGKLDKQAAVQKMTWATLDGERIIVVARQNGKIDCLHPDTGAVVKSFVDEEISKALEEKATSRVRFIGLETTPTHLMTCNSKGTLTWTEWSASTLNVLTTLSSASTTGGSTIAGPGTDLEIVRAHPVHRHLIAVGGKDIDVQIYDINAFLASSSTEPATASEKVTTSNTTSSEAASAKTHPRQKQKQSKPGLLYEAKNLKNDYLDLPQPVWIHDLQFMDKEGTQVAVATHYHQIRMYDFKKARRPVLNVEVGKAPLVSLSVGEDHDHVVFTSTLTDVGIMNIRTGKVIAQLKGFAGAAKATCTLPIPTFDAPQTSSSSTSDSASASSPHCLVSVSLDRTLRLHELDTKFRKLEKKVYLKQRLTTVLVDTDYVVPTPEQEQEQKEEEELWNTLTTVEDQQQEKKKKKTRLN